MLVMKSFIEIFDAGYSSSSELEELELHEVDSTRDESPSSKGIGEDVRSGCASPECGS